MITTRCVSCVLIALSFVLAIGPAVGQVMPARKPSERAFPFYSEKERGWFWKEFVPEPVDEDPVPPASQAAPTSPPTAPTQASSGPKPLSAQWIRENVDKYLDKAIEDPSPQNLSNYLYLQKLAVDSADRFSQAYRRVALADPALDANTERPLWSAAAFANDARAKRETERLIADLAKRFGIWFFFQSGCESCAIQAPVIQAFADRYKFTILPISLDGANIEAAPFKSFVRDRGQAARLNVQFTPSIFLVAPPDRIIPIAQAPIAMDELERRIVELSTSLGEVPEERYQLTRADTKNLLPPPSAVVMPSEATLDDPNAVRQKLRSLLKTSRR